MTAQVLWYAGGVLIGALTGFMIGKMHERWEWNQLIRIGKIRRPR